MKLDREVLYRELVLDDEDICNECAHLDDCPLLNSIKYGVVDIVDPDNFFIEDCGAYIDSIKER